MSVRLNDTEFTYISAKVRALEKSLVGRECLSRMIDAKSTADAAAYLREYGIDLSQADNAAARENILMGVLGAGMDEIEKSSPVAGLFTYLRYPYDCSNVKSAIKCGFRGIDCTGMLFDIGSVSAENIVRAYENRDFSLLPREMAKAAPEAVAAYVKTKNPQQIDFILDRACFVDMARAARESGIGTSERLTAARADLTGFIICLRVLRMDCGAYGEKLVEASLPGGGTIENDKFLAAFGEGEDELIRLLDKNGYPGVAKKLRTDCETEYAERVCDNYRMELVREAKHVTFGPQIPLAYLLALEYEIQNIRIILAGKDAGIPSAKIVERLRECYV